MISTPQGEDAQSTSNPDLRLKITRVGGLLPMQRSVEIDLNSLSSGERAAVQALFTMKAPDSADTATPDATSYKFELDGPTKHISITIKGMLIPALIRKLLP